MSFCDLNFSRAGDTEQLLQRNLLLITTQPSSCSSPSSSSLTGTNLSSFVCAFFPGRQSEPARRPQQTLGSFGFISCCGGLISTWAAEGAARGDNSSDVLFMSGRSQGQTDCFQVHPGV